MPTIEDIVILEDKMYILAEQCKGCSFCIEFCPKHVLVVSEEFNAKGYHPPGIDAKANCSNCKLCELLCPEFAIYSTDYSLKKGAAARNGLEEGQQ
jgi:2-oxoglutarate ferredoxin oxidoreductase subunit delta